MDRRQINAWCVYDFANTIYSALVLTFFFPIFVNNYLGGNEAQLGTVTAVSTFLSALIVPVVGAWSDQIGRRMPFLIVCTIGCCLAVTGVAFSSLYWALGLAVLANFFYSISLAVYDALLPRLATRENQGTISGWGVGIGYLGTPFSLIMVSILLGVLGWESETGIRATFILAAGLFLGFSVYTFLVIDEPRLATGRSFREELAKAFADLARTLKTLHHNKGFFPFLISAFLFYNAIMAVVIFLYLFGQSELGLTPQGFVMIYAGMALAAALGAVGSGYLVDKLGPKAVMLLQAITWILVLIVFLNVNTLSVFIGAGMFGAMAMAAYQASVRPLLIQFADPEKMGEYFGFLALINKASGMIGPLVFGWAVWLTRQPGFVEWLGGTIEPDGDITGLGAWAMFSGYSAGLLTLLVFFLVGVLCLFTVPDQRAKPWRSLFTRSES